MQPALIIVSNRLPVSVKKTDKGLEFYPSVGGLATGLAGYTKDRRNKWIGWPGIANEQLTEAEKVRITDELRKHNCYPVFLSQKQLDDFYNGYSNSILWPLFHDVAITPAALKQQGHFWKAYRQVNAAFAEVVFALSRTGSRIWVHDYQLMLLPAMLRRERPYDKIGFFLHIPFPPAKNFTELPEAVALLGGVLGADLVGFHTDHYVQNFLSSCQQSDIGLLTEGGLVLGQRIIRITDFPMGIDYAKFASATQQIGVKRELLKLKTKYRGRKVILTVDRLDPTKGLVERAKAYQEFLRRNSQLRGKVVMTMLAVPSRTEIDAYKKLRQQLEALVRDINREFHTAHWQPIEYLYTSMPFEKLTALYQRADVAFIAPLRDGMNLVAKEYLASKPNKNGVLILSKTAGAAEELSQALVVDPAQPQTLVDALTKAVSMPKTELRRRVGHMQKHLSTFTVEHWANNFMRSLRQSPGLPSVRTKTLSAALQRQLIAEYSAAKKRLLLLDYDGVLVPFADRPELAQPPSHLKKVLQKLTAESHTTVVVISGRSKVDLTNWFQDIPITLAAEHGAFTRRAGSQSWQAAKGYDASWKHKVHDLLEQYAAKTPGAFVEQKESSLVWHYRQASAYYAQKHLVILKRLLRPLARQFDLNIEQGSMILEVRPHGINKGSAALAELDDADFVLAIGDDTTDEDMFWSLPLNSWTVKVGRGRTAARYRCKNVDDVMDVLESLSR